jgi:reverse gyrase
MAQGMVLYVIWLLFVGCNAFFAESPEQPPPELGTEEKIPKDKKKEKNKKEKKEKKKENHNSLIYAAATGDASAIKRLLEQGAYP